ncbi:hypothetical protein OB03_02060 [Brevundimonas sp. GN22]
MTDRSADADIAQRDVGVEWRLLRRNIRDQRRKRRAISCHLAQVADFSGKQEVEVLWIGPLWPQPNLPCLIFFAEVGRH